MIQLLLHIACHGYKCKGDEATKEVVGLGSGDSASGIRRVTMCWHSHDVIGDTTEQG